MWYALSNPYYDSRWPQRLPTSVQRNATSESCKSHLISSPTIMQCQVRRCTRLVSSPFLANGNSSAQGPQDVLQRRRPSSPNPPFSLLRKNLQLGLKQWYYSGGNVNVHLSKWAIPRVHPGRFYPSFQFSCPQERPLLWPTWIPVQNRYFSNATSNFASALQRSLLNKIP